MCTTWLINGKYCESGADLVEAIGGENAHYVNAASYELAPTLHDAENACLCHVDADRLKEVTGKRWAYSSGQDVMVPADIRERE